MPNLLQSLYGVFGDKFFADFGVPPGAASDPSTDEEQPDVDACGEVVKSALDETHLVAVKDGGAEDDVEGEEESGAKKGFDLAPAFPNEARVDFDRREEAFHGRLGGTENPVGEVDLELLGFAAGSKVFKRVDHLKAKADFAVVDDQSEGFGELHAAEVGAFFSGHEGGGGKVVAVDAEGGLAALVVEDFIVEPHITLVATGDDSGLADFDFDGDGVFAGDLVLEFAKGDAEVDEVAGAAVEVSEKEVHADQEHVALGVHDPGLVVGKGGAEEDEDVDRGG